MDRRDVLVLGTASLAAVAAALPNGARASILSDTKGAETIPFVSETTYLSSLQDWSIERELSGEVGHLTISREAFKYLRHANQIDYLTIAPNRPVWPTYSGHPLIVLDSVYSAERLTKLTDLATS